jgi:hypothetical protein
VTLPDERWRSLILTEEFLKDLLSPSMTPKVPKAIRQRASMLLRHWPSRYHLEMLTVDMPNYYAKEIEPLYRMVKKYKLNGEAIQSMPPNQENTNT